MGAFRRGAHEREGLVTRVARGVRVRAEHLS
jgi:hypothetical protein